MGQVLVNEEHLKSTANAIRAKLGSNETFTPAEFSSGIESINMNYQPQSKGLIINSVNDAGRPTNVSFVGMDYLPDYYFYNLIKQNYLLQYANNNSISLPNNLRYIGQYCFYYCDNLSRIKLPDSIEDIRDYAFYYCSRLNASSLPTNLKILGHYAFYSCSSLTLTALPENLESIGNHCFYSASGLKLKTLPESVISIGNYAFYNCTGITLSKFPDNLKDINAYTFNNCNKMTVSQLPESLETIGDHGLYQCSNITITSLPSTLKSIGSYGLAGCSKIELSELPEGLESIGNYAFNNSPLVYFTSLPSSLKSIGSYSLKTCAELTELPDSVTSIGERAFETNLNITINKLPESLKTISQYAFSGCKNITISEMPKNVTSIPTYAFGTCSGITKLKILGNITYFGGNSFRDTKIAELEMPYITKVPTHDSYAFLNTPIYNKQGIIKVPHNLLASFETASNWKSYAGIYVGLDLESIEILTKEINSVKQNTIIDIGYNNGCTVEALGEYAGYTLTCSDNATLDGNILTLTEGTQEGDIITISATSTYNPEITTTKELTVVYKPSYYEIELNDGQWVDSGTTIDGNIVYQSDAGSYHINNGKSIATITTHNVSRLKLHIRSYGESAYDYTEAFAIDTSATRGSGKFTTKNKASATVYTECIYELDGKTHTIDVMYSTDASGYQNDDRGYFYISEYE